MIRGLVRGGSVALAAALTGLWLILPCMAGENGLSAPQSPPTPPPPPAAVPLHEIPMRAAEVTTVLQMIEAHLAPNEAVETITAKLPGFRREIDRDLLETTDILRDTPTLSSLQGREKLWQERRHQASAWLKSLTAKAVQLKDASHRLDTLRTTWAKTREATTGVETPEPIIQQIDAVIASIDAVKTPLEREHAKILDLQGALAQEVARCESVFAQVDQALERAVSSLFTRDGPPLWSPVLLDETGESVSNSVRRVLVSNWREMRQYVGSSPRVLVHAGLFILAALLFVAVGRRTRAQDGKGAWTASRLAVFDRPWSAAYIVSLLFATGPFSPAPDTLQNLLAVAAFVPMIRLVTPMGPEVHLWATMAGLLFGLDCIRQLISGALLLEQALLVLESLAGVAVLEWARRRVSIRFGHALQGHSLLHRMVPAVYGLLLVGLTLAACAGVFGFMRLARLLGSSALGIGFVGLLLYCLLGIATGLAAVSLAVWPLGSLLMVQHHRELLLRRTHRVLMLLILCAGLIRSLDRLGLFQPALTLGEAILTTKLQRGAISLSLADVVAFFLTVWTSILLSAFIRFVLKEDVYPRLHVPVGLSYAASSLLNYIILGLGFVVGLGVLGMDLTRVTVLAGALGVGIGFGLQSVVNNFVSGLILLFERPIHVGDHIELDGLLGEVRRIGIRASTIRTRQGAEIIIPNAQLVTDKVTNWTLSDQLRRIDLPVGVNYGADPRAVIALLEQVARDHPRVLKQPSPHGLFVGLGDSAINFELRAWTDAYTDWNRVRSDLTTAVYDAVQAAGLSFPYPQHEVRLLNLSESNGFPDEATLPAKRQS